MTVLGLLYHLESLGIQLRAAGSEIRFRAPEGVLTDSLKELVREHKADLLKMLEARRKFGFPEAALFPLIEHSVVTVQGSGELLGVFRKFCRVQLHRSGAVVLYPPEDLVALEVHEFAEELAA